MGANEYPCLASFIQLPPTFARDRPILRSAAAWGPFFVLADFGEPPKAEVRILGILGSSRFRLCACFWLRVARTFPEVHAAEANAIVAERLEALERKVTMHGRRIATLEKQMKELNAKED